MRKLICKLVALDIDKKAVIAVGSDIQELILKSKKVGATGRIYIRKIEDYPTTGLPVY